LASVHSSTSPSVEMETKARLFCISSVCTRGNDHAKQRWSSGSSGCTGCVANLATAHA
jgi:hypothetical protein